VDIKKTDLCEVYDSVYIFYLPL